MIKAHIQDIAPSPKCNNIIPSSRFKKMIPPQSIVTNSAIGDNDDEIDTQSISSNENDSPSRHNSFTSYTNIDDNNNNDKFKLSATIHQMRSSKSSRITTRLLATSSDEIEVDDSINAQSSNLLLSPVEQNGNNTSKY
ncbi:4819_t:CDS:2 [Racocetra fulgida]|uniref:4819_t:CDS:1 n=1 Tax=Racocetra fulgida TaxID=60492 RepID=A0A9N8WHK3_9GLOM|nr:4819_t:CDS:2 [Racocetra fulgida]